LSFIEDLREDFCLMKTRITSLVIDSVIIVQEKYMANQIELKIRDTLG